MRLKLRELRKNNNLTQEEIGKILNMTQSTYQTYENNRALPNLENLIKLADYYNVSLDYICNHKTPYQQDLDYLDENDKTIIELCKQLNEVNKIKALTFISGLVAGQ